MNPDTQQRFADEYYGEGFPFRTEWRQVPTVKCPMDMWAYAELILANRPDFLIETGTYRGGSAVFFADMMTLTGRGLVVTIDRARAGTVPHDRVRYLSGDCLALVDEVKWLVGEGSCMVVLDSDHKAGHVTAEMDLYGPLVTSGQYLVVEDTNLDSLPGSEFAGDGPATAVARWLPDHPEFSVDARCERHGLTMNPGGWLRRS